MRCVSRPSSSLGSASPADRALAWTLPLLPPWGQLLGGQSVDRQARQLPGGAGDGRCHGGGGGRGSGDPPPRPPGSHQAGESPD